MVDEMVKENLEDSDKIPDLFKNTSTYRIIMALKKNLKENKWYLISFIITVVFLVLACFFKVREADGIYSSESSDTSIEEVSSNEN